MATKTITIVLIATIATATIATDETSDSKYGDVFFDMLNSRYRVERVVPKDDAAATGDRAMLTPLIEKNDLSGARAASVVDRDLMMNVDSHAGYITVDKKYNSNMWFWYFPAEEVDPDRAPFVIWLQGGPGASSLFGLFEELGPFTVNEDGTDLIINPNSWHRHHNLLFIDNPVGTGFSFTDHEDGYATNQTIIGQQLYIFLVQFLRVFPELQKAPLFITGESYAGKHIPSFAYEIHKKNPTAKLKVNLKGLAIGNGFIDPASMTKYSDYVYQLGLADDDQTATIRFFEGLCDGALAVGDYKHAFNFFSYALGYFGYYSRIESIYNYVYETDLSLNGPFTKFIQRSEIRKALHVGNTEFAPIWNVYKHLIPDFMKSAKPWLEELLEHYRIMVYSGQMDIIVAYPLSIRTYRSLKWSGSRDYLDATRKRWYVNDTVAGYTKTAGNLFEVFVRNAGHMVPTDKPERSLLLLRSFINETPLDDEPSSGGDDEDDRFINKN